MAMHDAAMLYHFDGLLLPAVATRSCQIYRFSSLLLVSFSMGGSWEQFVFLVSTRFFMLSDSETTLCWMLVICNKVQPVKTSCWY